MVINDVIFDSRHVGGQAIPGYTGLVHLEPGHVHVQANLQINGDSSDDHRVHHWLAPEDSWKNIAEPAQFKGTCCGGDHNLIIVHEVACDGSHAEAGPNDRVDLVACVLQHILIAHLPRRLVTAPRSGNPA